MLVDVLYDLDNLNRLIDADEGSYSSGGGGSISSRTRREEWTMGHTGNWKVRKLDLDGDGSYTGADELNELNPLTGVNAHFSRANEWTARDLLGNGTDDHTLTYDKVGNLTDDGDRYEYVWDVFGRLVKIKASGTTTVIAEYSYYGNNHRASEKYDTDVDGDVDANDKEYFFAYNERWQLMAVYREDDSDPKEEFVYHTAGASGYGGSSYIDDVVLRDRDDNTAWTAASDGTMEQRRYYCQNWRRDVVAIVTDTGELAERARYSSYGVPFGMPLGDVNGDGTVDGADTGLILTDYSTSNWRSDLNLDGTVDSSDTTIANGNWGATAGRGVRSDVGNRKGYAGYEADFANDVLIHVRYRVYHAEMGRWTRRDPLGYVDGMNVYGYGVNTPITQVDPTGTSCVPGTIKVTYFAKHCIIKKWGFNNNQSAIMWCTFTAKCIIDQWGETKWIEVPPRKCVTPCLTYGTPPPPTPAPFIPAPGTTLNPCQKFAQTQKKIDCQACCDWWDSYTPVPLPPTRGGLSMPDDSTICYCACEKLIQ